MCHFPTLFIPHVSGTKQWSFLALCRSRVVYTGCKPNRQPYSQPKPKSKSKNRLRSKYKAKSTSKVGMLSSHSHAQNSQMAIKREKGIVLSRIKEERQDKTRILKALKAPADR